MGSEDAIRRTQELLTQEGMFVGISTGAILHAALILAKRAVTANESADIALIVCDAGWKYLSSGVYTGTVEDVSKNLEDQIWA